MPHATIFELNVDSYRRKTAIEKTRGAARQSNQILEDPALPRYREASASGELQGGHKNGVAKAKMVKTVHKSKLANQDGQRRLLCAQPTPIPVVIPPDLAPLRASAIRIGAKKWVNGTVLHYCFLDSQNPPKWKWSEDQKKVVRTSFGLWKQLGMGLSFIEVSDQTEAEILIGNLLDNRSWSLVGTDNLNTSYRDAGRTMNFCWDLTTTLGNATAIHEIGHAIGLSHEHQSPKSGIVWNEKLVYEYFSGRPNNWDEATIKSNIIQKLDPSEVEGSTWDSTSIMEYPFEPGLIQAPKPFDTQGIGENTKISSSDAAWVKRWYPPLAESSPIGVMELERLNASSGQQRDFSFQPDSTRDYTIQVIGAADCKIVLFEVRDEEPRHFLSADDSGSEANVKIKSKFIKGRTYIIRVRVNYTSTPDAVGLLIS